MRTMDSLQKVKEAEDILKNYLKSVKDTLQSEDNLTEEEIGGAKTRNNPPAKDGQDKQPRKMDMVAPDKQRKTSDKNDSVRH